MTSTTLIPSLIAAPSIKLLQTVSDYSPRHEALRQKIISGTYLDQHDPDHALLGSLMNLFVAEVLANTERLCSTYERGLWRVNALGYLDLSSTVTAHKCQTCFFELDVNLQELGWAMSIMGWNHLLGHDALSDAAENFCRYMYHLGHVLLDTYKAPKGDTSLDVGKIIDILD